MSSAGFWPGGAGAPGGLFFCACAYPVPPGFGEAKVEPEAARFDAALLAFLEGSYRAAADLGEWNRAAFECPLGVPHVPRVVR